MGAFWEARRLQWSHVTHMTTVPSVNDGLADKGPTLRDFETLGGYIVKIETSVAELKIAVNFRGVIRTFHLSQSRKQ
jgi:hypothetical protein